MRKALMFIAPGLLLAILAWYAIPSQAETAQENAASVAVPLQRFPRLLHPARLTADGWQAIVPGIDYRQYVLPDPNNVFVARLERANLDLTIDTSIAQGRLSGGTETVRGMATRYDDAINFWGQSYATPTWGTRNQVVVAINGYYYDIPTGIPWSGMVQSGWYAKRFDDCGGSLNGGSGFAWKLNRSAFIGGNVVNPPNKQIITFLDTSTSVEFQGINRPREDDELILYTPQYDANTGTDDTGVEVLVEMSRPTLILPPSSAYAHGVVRQIRDLAGSTPIPFDHVVLSAHGEARDELLANLQVGDEIGISQEVTDYNSGCSQSTGSQWVKTYASLGGAFHFLLNGEIEHFTDPGATSRAPRTAIAFNDQYIYFVVVDGRDPWRSLGMTIDELALFSRDTLSATYGIAQDGGGSSTLVINGQIMNNTFCNIHYCRVIYLPMVVGGGASQEQAAPPPGTEPEASALFDERAVANGVMMVVVQPPEKSTAFSEGQEVVALTTGDLYLGPGSNYAAFASVNAGMHGTIVAHEAGLNGIWAKGTYWWKVDFGGDEVGWIPAERLGAAQVDEAGKGEVPLDPGH